MAILKLVVKGTLLTIDTPIKLIATQINYDKFSVAFGAEWDGHVKTVVFFTDMVAPVKVVLSADETYNIPAEVLAEPGTLYFGVYGIIADPLDRITTNPESLKIGIGSYMDAAIPDPPTPDEYTQIVGIMQTQSVDALAAQAAQTAAETAYNDTVTIKNGIVVDEAARQASEIIRIGSETTRQENEAERVEAENAIIENENNRIDAESDRVSAENSREGNESTRNIADGARTSNESGRVTAENGRVLAESGRVLVESGRVSSELLRVSAETTRGENESTRKENETERMLVESDRVTAESGRTTAETNRVLAESTRVTAEGGRFTAEEGRVTAENVRVEIFTTYEDQVTQSETEIDGLTAYTSRTMWVKDPAIGHTKQVTDYGMITLPNNSKSQVSALSLKGNTRNNLVKSSNMNVDTNVDGVVDNFTPETILTVAFSLNDSAQKIAVTNSSAINQYAEVTQALTNQFTPGEVVSFRIDYKFTLTSGAKVQLFGVWKDSGGGFLSVTTIIEQVASTKGYATMSLSNVTVPANAVTFGITIRVTATMIGSVANAWLKNCALEKAASIPNYISSGSKSTLSQRVKSVGVNRFNGKVYGLMSDGGIVDGRNVYKLIHGTAKFWDCVCEPNTRYTVKFNYKYVPGLGVTYFLFYYSDGSVSPNGGSTTLISQTWASKTFVSETGKTIVGFSQSFNNTGTTYIDKDTVMFNEGVTALPYEPFKDGGIIYTPSDLILQKVGNAYDELSYSELIGRWEKTQNVEITTNVASGTVINYADMAVGGQFVAYNANGAIIQIGVKGDTLTAIAVTLTYQLTVPVITPIDVVGELYASPNGTVYAEPCISGFMDGVAKKVVTTTALPILAIRSVVRYDISTTGQLTKTDVTANCTVGDNNTSITIAGVDLNKTYFYDCSYASELSTTVEIVADVEVDNGIISHDYGAAAVDWTLNSNESLATFLTCTNAGGAVKIITPAKDGKMCIIKNTCGQTITFKTVTSTGIAILNTKRATVIFNGADYEKISEV